MGRQNLWSSICADLREAFVPDHLCTSGNFFVLALLAWSVSVWLDKPSVWEGMSETVALVYMNLVGMCGILVALVALPAMRLSRIFRSVSAQSNRLAEIASKLSWMAYMLGAVAIGVLCAQLTVGLAALGGFDWRIGLQLIWIVTALGAVICTNAVMWLMARTLHAGHRHSPLLSTIQSLPVTIYAAGWIGCTGIVVGVVLLNGS